MIIDQETIPTVRLFITAPSMFFDERNGIIFGVICELADKAIGVDAMIVHSTLKTKGLLDRAGGIERLKELANSVPTSAHAEYYAAIVKEKAMYRAAISLCVGSIQAAYAEQPVAADVLSELQRGAGSISETGVSITGVLAGDCLEGVLEEIHAPHLQVEQGGIPTGLAGVDAHIGGMKRKQLIALCGHGKHGKTALGLGIIAHAGLLLDEACAVISFEMGKEELAKRLLLWACEIPERQLKRGHGDADLWNRYQSAQTQILHSKIVIDDECPPNIPAVRARLQLYKRRYGIKLAMVDYYQLMEGTDFRQRRYEQLVDVSRGLKKLAVELDIPVLVLAQLNAEAEREDRLPRMNDIEECKRLAKDANVVMLLDREYMRKKNDPAWVDANSDKVARATLDIGGARASGGGVVELVYDAPITKFKSFHQQTF